MLYVFSWQIKQKIDQNSSKIKYLGTTVSTTSWPAPCQNFSLQKQCKGLKLTVREATNGDSSESDQWFSRSSNMHVFTQRFTKNHSPHLSTSSRSHPTFIKIFSPEHIGWIKAFLFWDVSQTFPNKPCNVDWTPEETEMHLQSFWIVLTMAWIAWWYWSYHKLSCVCFLSGIVECLHLDTHDQESVKPWTDNACCQYISIFQLRIRHTEAILQSS